MSFSNFLPFPKISWYHNVSFVCDEIFYLHLMQLDIVSHKILLANFIGKFYWQIIFCKWREIWKAHIKSNMFLPYHAKNQPHFQVSERTYSRFIEIRKDAKISWFLQMAGNLKSSYRFKHVFTLPCQKSASFSGVRKDL